MNPSMITVKPRMSEKAYNHSVTRNVYVFQVPLDANKSTIKQAVEKQFDVTVLLVNTTVTKGKTKRQFQKRGKANTGTRVDIKKAYVTLKEGDSIPVFSNAEEEKN
jgi:large subunit ribosomal protein L23